MDSKNFGKGLSIASTSIIFLGLVFAYIYRMFNYSGMDFINTRYQTFIFTFSGIFIGIKIIADIMNIQNALFKVIFSIIELLIVGYLTILNAPMIWPYFLLAAIIISSTLLLGRRFGLMVLIVVGFITFGKPLIQHGLNVFTEEKFLELWIIYASEIFMWYFSDLIASQRIENLKMIQKQKMGNEHLIKANSQIEENLKETVQLNQSLEAANKRLEETNEKLNKSVAEFYTLQQISKAIATIMDINELLGFVNDVIIGVMGANYSTVILLNKENGKMEIKMTNIASDEELKILKGNINFEELINVVSKGQSLLENNMDESKYKFTSGREIKSLLCIPLSSKNETHGMVLIEFKRIGSFDEEHLKFLSVIANQVSVTLENVGLYEKMQKMATIDGLTRIYNRLYFQELLSKEMIKADQGGYPMALSIFDIDFFKKFNDTYGHLFGDRVLKVISRVAKDSIRNEDSIARYGGEEFVILMPNTTADQAFKLIDKIRKNICDTNVKEETVTASVTASFGVACYPDNGSTESEILSAADTALYKAKEEGRNCVRVFEGTKNKNK